MSKKILINGVTLEDGNIIPLLLKVKYWQTIECKITIFGNKLVKDRIDNLKIINGYEFIEIRHSKKIRNKFQFIFEGVKRNFLAFFYLKKFKGRYDIIYSISSVLDLIIFPYLLKKVDKKIKWVTVFDNTVPLFSGKKMIAGNKAVRILAWTFFKMSLLLLRKSDFIFVIKPELKKYLLQKGFEHKRLILTGNGVEMEFIKKAKKIEGLNIDALFIGRINEAKGIYDMLMVLRILKKRYSKFNLYIMGRGDDATENKFKEAIKKEKLEKNVHFLGYKTGQEKFDIIKSSKIFLFLSETESVPISPLEAVCSGLKTLVYDLEAYNMYKNNEVIIFKKNDYRAVAKKVIDLFENKDFNNKAGELLLDRYSWNSVSKIELACFLGLNSRE